MATDRTLEVPGRAAVGRQPDPGVRHHEARRLTGNDEIRAGDEREPGACRAPLHRGDHGDVDRGEPGDRDVEPIDDLGEPGIEIGTGVGERPDVSTPAEPSTGTGHEHRAEVVAARRAAG